MRAPSGVLFSDFAGLGSACLAVPLLLALEAAEPQLRYAYPDNALFRAPGLREHLGVKGLVATPPARWRQWAERDWSSISHLLQRYHLDAVINFRNPDLRDDPDYARWSDWQRGEALDVQYYDLYQQARLRDIDDLHVQDRMLLLTRAAGLDLGALPKTWLVGWAAPAGPRPTTTVGVFPSASTTTKRWPRAHWLALVCRIAEENDSVQVDLLCGATREEREFTYDLYLEASRAYASRVNLVQTDDLKALAKNLSRLTLLVSNDTGVGHVAAALGVSTLTLHLATRAQVWSPTGPDSVTIQSLIGERCPGQRPSQGNCVRHYGDCDAPCQWDVRPSAVAQQVRHILTHEQ